MVKITFEIEKEHKPSAEEILAKAGIKPYKDGNKWCILVGDNIQEGICGFGDTIDEALYQFLKDVLEQQKEPKPAEWSEEDNIGWNESLACVTRAEKAAKNEEELQNAITAEKWLKEIKFKYYVHPVKQEWSAEDEEMLDAMIDIVSNYPYEPLCPREGMIVWLKSIKNRGNSTKSNTNSNSWKPSEEQMDALKKVINWEFSAGLHTRGKTLQTLYNDLTKLM